MMLSRDRRRLDGRAREAALADLKGIGNPHHLLAGGQGALPQNSQGTDPGTATTSSPSGDLIEDLTHNFFLETGARNGKLKVYEMVEHPATRTLTGYLLVRGGRRTGSGAAVGCHAEFGPSSAGVNEPLRPSISPTNFTSSS